MQPGIILLREGTDSSQGVPQLVSNINACMAVADTIRTTLGPRGMDKLIFDGNKVTITNDGASIMKLLDVVHPAAKTLVDISMSQDAEVGDGTTSVVLLAGQILHQVKPFVEDRVHPQIIMKGIRKAAEVAVARLEEIAVPVDKESSRNMLEVFAGTALNSKLISNHKDLFCPMVVDAVCSLDLDNVDIHALVGVKKVPGGDVTQSFLVEGVAFKKTFSYAGFEQMEKEFTNPSILLLNVELELKSEKENAEVRITDPADYQSIVDAEWSIIYDKLDKCVQSGAQIILSKQPIGDLATQYFADRKLFCAGRVDPADMKRVAMATGGIMQSTVNDLTEAVLGKCGHFEEKQVGEERFNCFTLCTNAKTATIVLRGGSEQFIEESHRSIHDALMIVKRGLASRRVVAGGGAIEMEVSKSLRAHARTVDGKEQLIISAFAKALEVIPRQLCDNAGFDATGVLNKLRQKHAQEENGIWFGVDVDQEDICDTMLSNVWEPAINKINSYTAAAEAACVILSIDETVRNPQSEQPGAQSGGLTQQQQAQKLSSAMGGRGMQGMMGGRGGRGRPGVRRLK